MKFRLRKTSIFQIEVEKICREILTLGLLHGTLYDDEATLEEQPEWLTYPHKMFQDFLSGYHNSRLILRSKSKVLLDFHNISYHSCRTM